MNLKTLRPEYILAAAEHIADGRHTYCCNALKHVLRDHGFAYDDCCALARFFWHQFYGADHSVEQCCVGSRMVPFYSVHADDSRLWSTAALDVTRSSEAREVRLTMLALFHTLLANGDIKDFLS